MIAHRYPPSWMQTRFWCWTTRIVSAHTPRVGRCQRGHAAMWALQLQEESEGEPEQAAA
jgi:hypothetical protein